MKEVLEAENRETGSDSHPRGQTSVPVQVTVATSLGWERPWYVFISLFPRAVCVEP